ncbi:hypothetical protein SAMN05421812_102647 [Asanoa hainanensis]|uniref:Uncharacterized protein n=1 Tax=Asanoa hainanensis TaxID=560556 RepID=A0A239J0E7_9ACTN|nr:hypothetical protein [Asanoa hainanensis]SNS98938.1 hypothetical protein SAMN05421812_102647 [Asanoa hainanensis]
MTSIPTWPIDAWHWTVARPWLAAVAVAIVAAGLLGHNRVRAWRHRRMTGGARLVTIAPPPEVTAESAALFWTVLVGVLTPSVWRRRVFGIPHVAWEYLWSGRTLTIRVWVPGTVPPGAVEAAVRAAWPAATLTVTESDPPIPVGVGEQVGGAHWPQHTTVLPLRADHDVDPLRALLAAGANVRQHEHACVQVVARPARASRVRRARMTAAREPETWIWALLVGFSLLFGLAWVLKANTSNRPVDFMIRLSADLTTYFKIQADIQYRVPSNAGSQPATIEGQATPLTSDDTSAEEPPALGSAEGGDEP